MESKYQQTEQGEGQRTIAVQTGQIGGWLKEPRTVSRLYGHRYLSSQVLGNSTLDVRAKHELRRRWTRQHQWWSSAKSRTSSLR